MCLSAFTHLTGSHLEHVPRSLRTIFFLCFSCSLIYLSLCPGVAFLQICQNLLHPKALLAWFLSLKPFLDSVICMLSVSVMSDSATSWTIAHQAPLFMGFSRQEYWSGLPFPSPRGSSWPRDWIWSPALQADSLLSEPPRSPYIILGNKFTTPDLWRKVGNGFNLFLYLCHNVKTLFPWGSKEHCQK